MLSTSMIKSIPRAGGSVTPVEYDWLLAYESTAQSDADVAYSLHRTTDGASWSTPVSWNTSSAVFGLLGHNKNLFRISQGHSIGGIYKSTDYGLTFTNVLSAYFHPTPYLVDNYAYYISYSRFVVLDNYIYAFGNGNEIWRSQDDGETWTNDFWNIAFRPTSICRFNGLMYVTCGQDHKLYRCTDETSWTWEEVITSFNPGPDICEFNGYLYAGSTDLYRSSDGITWNSVITGKNPWRLFVADNCICFITRIITHNEYTSESFQLWFSPSGDLNDWNRSFNNLNSPRTEPVFFNGLWYSIDSGIVGDNFSYGRIITSSTINPGNWTRLSTSPEFVYWVHANYASLSGLTKI